MGAAIAITAGHAVRNRRWLVAGGIATVILNLSHVGQLLWIFAHH